MTLLPTVNAQYFENDFEYQQEPGHTYKMRVDLEDGTAGQIIGYTDGIDAVEQAVYKLLNTERGEFEIYKDQYGVEIDDLFGMPVIYVIPELDRRITDAVMQDDRVESVGNFSFDLPRKGVIHVAFKVTSIYGDINIQKDMEVS